MESLTPPHTYPPLSQEAINLALPEMSLVEYEAWQDFTSPPPRSENFTLENIMRKAPVDWDNTASTTPPFNEDSIAIATRRIKGLNYLYNTTKARLHHADWYATKYAETWSPVVDAVGRVLVWQKMLEDETVDQSIIDRSNICVEENKETPPSENIPIPWKSYNITSVPMEQIPPFDPLALKHALNDIGHSQKAEYKAYLAFNTGSITLATLTRDCPINWDHDFDTTPLSHNLNRHRVRKKEKGKKKKGDKRDVTTSICMKRMAEALSFLYQSERVTPGHAVWCARKYRNTQGGSLVRAVEKICQVERDIDVRPALW